MPAFLCGGVGDWDPCGARRWRIIESRWYAEPNATRQVLVERRDRLSFSDVAPGTLPDLFYEAACRL